jgi:hypothetical protein
MKNIDFWVLVALAALIWSMALFCFKLEVGLNPLEVSLNPVHFLFTIGGN